VKKFLRILFKSIATVLVSLIIVIVVLIFTGVTVNLDFMRGGVEVAASKALHRDVTISGPVALEFSYWPALDVSDLKISNVEGAASPDLLNAGLVRMQLGVFPLLKGEINIADITAEDVKLNLESDADGNPNWVFTKPDQVVSEPEIKSVANPPDNSEKKRIHFAALSHLSLTQISVDYHDAALNKTLSFVLESMEGTAAENQAIELKLNGRVQDKDYKLELEGDSINDLLDKSRPWGFGTKGEIFGKQVTGEGNLSLRGKQPTMRLAVAARDIDVGSILSALGLVEGMKASLGDVGMDFTVTGDSLQEILKESSMLFVVKKGNWKIAVPNTDAKIDIENLDGKIQVEKGNNISMALDGEIEEVPVELLITGAPLVDYVVNQEELPLSINAKILETQLNFDANIKLPLTSTEMSFALRVSSQRIDRLNELLDLKLPPIGPVSLESKLDITPQAYDLSSLNLKIGRSNLDGRFHLNLSQAKPKVEVSLISDLIQLDDFPTGKPGQSEAGQPEDKNENESTENPTGEEVPPEEDGKKWLSYEVLNGLDAQINIAAKQVLSGDDTLGSGEVKLALQDAHLQVEPITLKIPGGRFDAGIDYTPTPEDVTFSVRADVEEFDLGVLIRRLKPGNDMGGKLYLDIDFDSNAPDAASIMANASGHFDFGLVPENFSAGIIDLWAVNLLSAIMDKSTEKDQSTMNCVVVRTRMDDGILKEEAIYLDTSNMRIAGKTDINFKTRELEIKLAPKAKTPEFFSIAIPIQVKGSLDDFGLKIGVVRMAGQVISFITSPIHVPIRRIFTEASPEDGVEACTYAWTVTAENAGAAAKGEPEKEY